MIGRTSASPGIYSRCRSCEGQGTKHSGRYHDRSLDGSADRLGLSCEAVVDFNGDTLDILEYRHDWAHFGFTWDLFKYIFLTNHGDIPRCREYLR
jgi:hypothetical protein